MKRPRLGFRLYVAGNTPRSLAAIHNLKRICEKQIAGRYDLEVVDVYQQPERAAADKIIALPTLLRYSPGGAKRLIGDLSKEGIVCAELGLAS